MLLLLKCVTRNGVKVKNIMLKLGPGCQLKTSLSLSPVNLHYTNQIRY